MSFYFRIRNRDGRQKCLRIGVERLLVELCRVGNLNNNPKVHDGNPITDVLDHRQIMGDKQICQMKLFLQIPQKVENLGLYRNVQGADRLIGQYQLGVQRQRPGNTYALTLSAGKFVGIPVLEPFVQPHFLHQHFDPLINFLMGHLQQLAVDKYLHRLTDDLPYGHTWI